jgi:hypothetical protein
MKLFLRYFLLICILIANETQAQNAPNLQNRIVHWPQNMQANLSSNQLIYEYPNALPLGSPQSQEESGEDWWYDTESFYNNGVHEGYILCGYSTYKNIEYSEGELQPKGFYMPSPVDNPNTLINELTQCAPDCDHGLFPNQWNSEYIGAIGKYNKSGLLEWSKTIAHGSAFNAIKQTPDGGFIVIGETHALYNDQAIPYLYNPLNINDQSLVQNFPPTFSIEGIVDQVSHAIVIKFNSSGEEEWSFLYGPNTFLNPINAVNFVSYNNCYGQDIALNPTTGGYTLLLRTENRTGNIHLEQTLLINIKSDGLINDLSQDYRLISDPLKGYSTNFLDCKNGICIVNCNNIYGDTELFGSGRNGHPFLINQNTLQTLQSPTLIPIEDPSINQNNVKLQDNLIDSDGNFIVSYIIYESGGGGGGLNYGQGYVKKYDQNGNTINTVPLGELRAYDLKIGLKEKANGQYALVSTKIALNNGNADIVSDSHPIFGPIISSYIASTESPFGSCEASNLVLEVWNTDTYVAELNSDLSIAWQKTFDADDLPPQNAPGNRKKAECMYSIESDEFGGLFVCGNSSHNMDDYYTAKLYSDCQNNLSYSILDQIDNEILISNDITWNSPQTVIGTVKIPSGKTLTISNTTIEFADSKIVGIPTKIVVEPGGKLELINATLQAISECELAMWDGIEVQGNPSQAQLANLQGKTIISTSTIKNARTAISTKAMLGLNIIDWAHTGGGILQIDESNFINNQRSIEMMRYQAYNSNGTPTNEASYIYRSEFKTLSNLKEYGVVPTAQISLWDVNGLKILGNNFISELQSTNINENGIGVYSINSKFVLNEYCTSIQTQNIPCPAANTTASVFEGLYCGVYVNNTFDLSSAQIKNTSFNNNLYGIRLEGSHNNYITKCNFNIPLAYIPYKTGYAFGIYSKLSSFKVNTDNVFQNTGLGIYGSVSTGKNMGIYIENSEFSNGIAQITGNTFNNLAISLQFAGKNLALVDCNSFVHLTGGVDIHVPNGTMNNQVFINNINPLQSTIHPLTNQFISDCNSPKIISNSIDIWGYYQKENNVNGITQSCTQGNVFILPNSGSPACQFYSQSLSQSELTNMSNELINQILDLKEIARLGSREELIELINNSCSGINSIKDTLLVRSPFLSDSIQKELLQSCYSFLDKKEILQSNMPLSDDVRLAVMNSTLPYWIKMILVADEGRTPLEGLLQEIEGKQTTLRILETELINKFIDSSFNQSNSWTTSSTLFESKMNQYLFSGLLSDNNLFNLIDTNLLSSTLMSQLLYIQQLNDAKENDSLTYELIENSTAFVARQKRTSLPVLDYVDGYEINTNRNITATTPLMSTVTREKPNFSISPNPASNKVTLSFDIKELDKQIDIINLNGAVVKSAISGEEVLDLDLNGLAGGHYIIRVSYSDVKITTEFEKLIILE